MSCKIWKRVFCDKLDISRVFFPNTFPTHFVCSAQCAALHFHFLQANLPVTDKRAISGHSMGGHGALTIGLKNPERQPGQTCTHTHTHSRDTQSRFWFALKECTRKAHSCQGYRFGRWLRMLRYSSVSAFAPICNPTKVPWGQKAFKFYLGSDEQVQRRNCHGV